MFRADVLLVATVREVMSGALTLHADETHELGVAAEEPERSATTVFVNAANPGVRRHMLEVKAGDVVHVSGRLVGLRAAKKDKAQVVAVLATYVKTVARPRPKPTDAPEQRGRKFGDSK